MLLEEEPVPSTSWEETPRVEDPRIEIPALDRRGPLGLLRTDGLLSLTESLIEKLLEVAEEAVVTSAYNA